jgi:hypothetical protein
MGWMTTAMAKLISKIRHVVSVHRAINARVIPAPLIPKASAFVRQVRKPVTTMPQLERVGVNAKAKSCQQKKTATMA